MKETSTVRERGKQGKDEEEKYNTKNKNLGAGHMNMTAAIKKRTV